MIWTVGHSVRPIGEFLALLQAHGIGRVADVRRLPGSRRHPQFNEESLRKSLAEVGIRYRLWSALGGLRKPTRSSVNAGWRNSSFRGYADYMQTEKFRRALESLLSWALPVPTALLCAEALPWRCHRSLIADALGLRKVEVRHIFSRNQARTHRRTPFAKLSRGKLTYPES